MFKRCQCVRQLGNDEAKNERKSKEKQAKANHAKDGNETSERCLNSVRLESIFSKGEAKLTMQGTMVEEQDEGRKTQGKQA